MQIGLFPITFTGVNAKVIDIKTPKSIYVKDLHAKIGDTFALECILSFTTNKATQVKVINITHKDNPSVLIPQNQFFSTFSYKVFNFELIENAK